MNGMEYMQYDETVARRTDPESGRWVEVVHDDVTDAIKDLEQVTKWSLCFVRKYKGLDINNFNVDDPVGSSEFNEELDQIEAEGGLVVPIYMLDHSGVSVSLTPFGDKWDSGCGGYAVLTKIEIDSVFDGDKEKANAELENVVKIIDAGLNGRVYGLCMYDPSNEDNKCESIWGFIDTDGFDDVLSNMSEYAPDEGFKKLILSCVYGELDPLKISRIAYVEGGDKNEK